MNQLNDIRGIAAPTLVICGAEDPATPLAHSEALCDAIADSRLVVLQAAHLSKWRSRRISPPRSAIF